MIINVIADTYDNRQLMEKTVKILNENKVNLFLLAGDYVAQFVVKTFKSLRAKFVRVWQE